MTVRQKLGVSLVMLLCALAGLLLFLRMTGFSLRALFPGEEVHAKTAYEANWGLYLHEDSEELFYAETDHRAFGEGERYSVLSAPPEQQVFGIIAGNRLRKDSFSHTYGFQETPEIHQFLSDLWERLSVPGDYQCPLENCAWQRLAREDGSTLVLVILSPANTVYIAERLF